MKEYNVVSLVFGVISIVVGTVYGFLFGILPAFIGLVCGVVAIVLAIKTKKASNGEKGQAGFVCGIVGVTLGAFIFVGCLSCGATAAGQCGMWGCIGGQLKIEETVYNYGEDLEEALNALQDSGSFDAL